MENDTFGGAILAWVKSAKAFLKVQAGTGDNLLEEDIREGFTDYCLWSTFRPESIDTDGELDMECLDKRHGPVQGKLHPRRGAGIELPASLRHRLRQGRHRGTDGRMTPPFHLVGEASPWLALRCSPPPLLRAPPLKPWEAGTEPRKFLHYNYISEYEKKYKNKPLLSAMLN